MDENSSETWQRILEQLHQKLDNQPAYSLISGNLSPLNLNHGRVELAVSNTFTLRNIEQKYMPVLREALNEVLGEDVDLALQVGQSTVSPELPRATPEQQMQDRQAAAVRTRQQTDSNLNPRYTFDNFVVGSHNEFAHATAWRVAESPGQSYNPLFIYGGVGLGKTHLMQAIGHQILKNRPNYRVTYISSERFTNELINSLKDGTTLEFKNRYRSTDLLMIDDIQFIGGKETTQEEFFHTFNELHEAGKQVVITSDKPPNELSSLESRLRSRFQMGLNCDIQPPNFETRIAILKKKAEMDGLDIPDEVLHFIAKRYKANVRELEGALVKLMAYTSMTGTAPSVAMAQSVLGQVPERDVNSDLIKKVTSEYFEVKIEDLTGKSRQKKINQARQIAIYLCRELTDLSFPRIGEHFGNRDHTTIMYAFERISESIKENNKTREIVNTLISHLK